MTWWDEDAGDVAFADDQLQVSLPPAGRIIRRGGHFGLDDARRIPALPLLLRHLDEDGADFNDPDMAAMVAPDDVLAFCLQHGIETERALDLARGRESYKVLIRKGMLQSIWLNLLTFEEGDPVLAETGYPIPVAELHAPHVSGCHSSYEVLAADARSAGLDLRVRGVGAGGGVSARLQFRDRLWTEADCGQVTVPADIEAVPWRNPDSGAEFLVVSVTNVAAGEWNLTAIPDDRTHLCGPTLQDRLRQFNDGERRRWARSGVDFVRHRLEVAGGIERERRVERTRRFTLSAGDWLRLDSQFSEEYAYAYTVAGAGDYVGFYEHPRSEVFFWAWQAP